jgi:hypothetical protein
VDAAVNSGLDNLLGVVVIDVVEGGIRQPAEYADIDMVRHCNGVTVSDENDHFLPAKVILVCARSHQMEVI